MLNTVLVCGLGGGRGPWAWWPECWRDCPGCRRMLLAVADSGCGGAGAGGGPSLAVGIRPWTGQGAAGWAVGVVLGARGAPEALGSRR